MGGQLREVPTDTFLMERKEGHLLKGSEQPVSALDLPGGQSSSSEVVTNRPDPQGPAVCERPCQVLWALVSWSPSDLVRSPVLSPGGEECGQRVVTPALSNVWLLGRTSWK